MLIAMWGKRLEKRREEAKKPRTNSLWYSDEWLKVAWSRRGREMVGAGSETGASLARFSMRYTGE